MKELVSTFLVLKYWFLLLCNGHLFKQQSLKNHTLCWKKKRKKRGHNKQFSAFFSQSVFLEIILRLDININLKLGGINLSVFHTNWQMCTWLQKSTNHQKSACQPHWLYQGFSQCKRNVPVPPGNWALMQQNSMAALFGNKAIDQVNPVYIVQLKHWHVKTTNPSILSAYEILAKRVNTLHHWYLQGHSVCFSLVLLWKQLTTVTLPSIIHVGFLWCAPTPGITRKTKTPCDLTALTS